MPVAGSARCIPTDFILGLERELGTGEDAEQVSLRYPQIVTISRWSHVRGNEIGSIHNKTNSILPFTPQLATCSS